MSGPTPLNQNKPNNNGKNTFFLFSVHHLPDVFVCLILSTNIGICCATFHFLVPVYAYDIYGREFGLKIDGILGAQFASGCLYQYVMSE